MMARMRTELTTPTQAASPPPTAVLHSLLPESSSVKDTASEENLDSEQIELRATTVTVLLKEMLSEAGYRHGGINE